MAYVEHLAGPNSTANVLTRYYVTGGSGPNPLLEEMQYARENITTIKASISIIAQKCLAWSGAANMTLAVNGVDQSFGIGSSLLALEHVYAYYEKAVREGACQTMIMGLGWLVLFQVAVGLVCLP